MTLLVWALGVLFYVLLGVVLAAVWDDLIYRLTDEDEARIIFFWPVLVARWLVLDVGWWWFRTLVAILRGR